MVTFIKNLLSKAISTFSYIPTFIKNIFTGSSLTDSYPKISNINPLEKYALIIGCSYSQNKNIFLEKSAEEAKEMKNLIIKNYGFLESNILLLVDDNNSDSFKPTLSSIKKSLKLLQSYSEKGRAKFIYIFYTGLGSERRDLEFDLTNDRSSEEIVPIDFESSGSISFDQLKEIFLSNLDKNVTCLIVSDTCNMKSMNSLDYIYNPINRKWINGNKDEKIKANIILISSYIDDDYFNELDENGRICGIIKYCLEKFLSDGNSFQKIIDLSNQECRKLRVAKVPILSSTKMENGGYTL